MLGGEGGRGKEAGRELWVSALSFIEKRRADGCYTEKFWITPVRVWQTHATQPNYHALKGLCQRHVSGCPAASVVTELHSGCPAADIEYSLSAFQAGVGEPRLFIQVACLPTLSIALIHVSVNAGRRVA